MLVTLLPIFLLVTLPSMARELQTQKSSLVDTNLAAPADDVSSLFQPISHSISPWEPQDTKAETIRMVYSFEIPQSEGLKLVESVVEVLWDTVLQVRDSEKIKTLNYKFFSRFFSGFLSWVPSKD